TVLTIQPKDKDGNQRWELADGATLYDVTHLGCRSARYTPATGNNSCSPANAPTTGFPVNPGAAMPVVNGCRKQDYAVLIIVCLPATHGGAARRARPLATRTLVLHRMAGALP